jgi:putative MATE family efflux protein
MAVDVEPESAFEAPRELSGKLAGLSLSQQVWALAVWPLLEMLLTFLVGTVDLMLAGRLNPEPIALAATDALGVASFLGWLLAMIFQAVGVGATALIARAIGGRHRRLANAALGQALLMAVLLGVVVGAILWLAAPHMAYLAGRSNLANDYCTTYLRIIALAAPANAILLIGNAALRGAGDTRTPFGVMLTVNVVNIIASIAFVYGPAPIGGHGVGGIAAGTALAWWSGAVLTIAALLAGKGGLRLRLFRLRPHAHTLRRIIRVGMPNLFESVAGMWIGNFLVLMIVGKLAIDGIIGVHMIIIRFESLSFLAGAAMGITASTLAGQYLGLGDPVRARKAVMLCWGYASVIMSAIGILYLTIPRQLASLITDVEPMIEMSITPLRICGPIQVFFATQIVLAGALRGAGDTRSTMIITSCMTLLVRVPGVYLVGITFGYGFLGIWIVLAVELCLRAIVFAARFLHGGWTRVEV